MRGYFGIGIVGGKSACNVGTLWRSAYQLGASYIFTAGARYPKQAADTVRAWRHVPKFEFHSVADLLIPYDCMPVLIEMDGKPLSRFVHPERACYILGAEDHGIPKALLDKGWPIISLPFVRQASFNVAVAGKPGHDGQNHETRKRISGGGVCHPEWRPKSVSRGAR